jgi:sugar phosphate isomerase/epimerase
MNRRTPINSKQKQDNTMSEPRITRRGAIKAGAALALPLLATSAEGALAAAQAKPTLTIGIATTGFGTYTNQQMAEEIAQLGLHTVQLFFTQKDSRYWKYNGRSDLADMTPQRCRAISETYRAAAIAIHSMGVYTNLIDPDEAERKANLDYFEAMMKVGAEMGVRAFITEAGHHRTQKTVPPIPYDFQEAVWKQTVATVKDLAERAARYQATVLIEPSYRGFFASAKRTRVFLGEVGSPRIRVLLDPANLLELNDLEEMFSQLTPYIDCLHAKDFKLHSDRGGATGEGDLDYQKFVNLAVKHTPRAPLILEYVGPNNYKQALAHLRQAMRQVGVGEK